MTQTQRMRQPWWTAAGCLAVLILCSGCGGSSDGRNLTPVSGKVTYQGQPLSQGRITFMPLQPGDSCSGQIVDGAYTLSTYKPGDGAPPGQYQVAVTSWTKEPDMESAGEAAIPMKYFNAEQSELTAEVTDKAVPIDFNLTE